MNSSGVRDQRSERVTKSAILLRIVDLYLDAHPEDRTRGFTIDDVSKWTGLRGWYPVQIGDWRYVDGLLTPCATFTEAAR